MRIYLSNQSKKFSKHLAFFKSKKVIPYDRNLLKEVVSEIKLDQVENFDQLNFSLLFDYKIFPKNIMEGFGQWQEENRSMQEGDILVQQIFIPPNPKWSQKIITGVRISEIIDKADCKGFSYETLEGHVEKGISTFTIERKDEGIFFKIHTYSSPGNFLSKLVGPIFSKHYQNYSTKKALEHFKQLYKPK
ncbi:MAG: DUF1990 family protein [Crocinitomicaceae bacterium]|nr:DUF1990 family protein [Crocinitomicaceae bacterium]